MPLRQLLAPLFLGLALGFAAAAGPSCGNSAACNPTNCSKGCCSDGVCVSSPNNARVASCGTAGSVCANCGTHSCVDFACTGGTGGGTGSCGPGCNGCCSGTSSQSVCIQPSVTNCGANGAVCASCGSGQDCVGGRCTATDGGAGRVGTPCGLDEQCAGLGAGHRCKKTTNGGGDPYENGYCTKDCVDEVDCPSKAVCVSAPKFGEADAVCWAPCTTGADCRPGYDCYPVGAGLSACWISPLPVFAFDAGPAADKVGQPCKQDLTCQNPPDDGACLPDTLNDGGPSAFLDGYCSAPCGDSSHCSPDGGAKCISLGDLGVCVQACPAPGLGQGTCRAGYVCQRVRAPDGGAVADGFCWPRCSNTGFNCGLSTCLPSGYCG